MAQAQNEQHSHGSARRLGRAFALLLLFCGGVFAGWQAIQEGTRAADPVTVQGPSYQARFDGSGLSMHMERGRKYRLDIGTERVTTGEYTLFDAKLGGALWEMEPHLTFDSLTDVTSFSRKSSSAARYRLAKGLSQRFIARDFGVEQIWEVEKIPSGGDLTITNRIVTPLTARTEAGGVVRFYTADGHYVTSYGQATITDRAGRRLLVDSKLAAVDADAADASGGSGEPGDNHYLIALNLPEEWLATAEYPVIIDPLIGVEIPVASIPGTLEHDPEIAVGGTEHLVVFTEQVGALGAVHGIRLTINGAVQLPEITISGAGDAHSPDVAFDGTDWFVTWVEDDDIMGAFVDATGVVSGTVALTADGATLIDAVPKVAYNVTNNQFLVVWERDINISAAFVNGTTGLPGAVFNISATTATETNPSLSFIPQKGQGNDTVDYFMVGWVADNNVYATRVDGTGTVDPVALTIMDGGITGATLATSVAVGSDPTDWAANFIIIWTDDRNAAGDEDVWAVRVTKEATLMDVTDISVSAAPGSETEVDALLVGGSTYFITWTHRARASQPDIFASRLLFGSGLVMDPGGIEVAITGSAQTQPAISWDGTNYMVVWSDDRDTGFSDVYAQRIPNVFPEAPTALVAADTPGDLGGSVDLSWSPSASAGVTQQRIYRETAADGQFTNLIQTITGNATNTYTDTDPALVDDTTYYYVVRAFDGTYESGDSLMASAAPHDNITVNAFFSSISQAVSEGGPPGTTNATARVQLTNLSGTDVTVPFTVDVLSTATLGTDYTISPASPLTITAGQAFADITVTLTGDTDFEPDETVVINLGTPTGAGLGTPTSHTVNITNDDIQPSVTFALGAQNSNEGLAATVPVTLNLSALSAWDVTVPYTIGAASTASGAGVDYSLAPAGQVVISAGQISADLSVTVVNDLLHETASETVIVDMDTVGLVNATAGATVQHTLNIVDDDTEPVVTFALGASSISEGAGSFNIQVNLGAASGLDTDIPFTIDGAGTALGAGVDYTMLTASPLTIPAGSTSGQIQVQLTGDLLDEYNETLILNMGVPVNAVTDGTSITQHTFTINDDDVTPSVAFTAASQSKAENGAMSLTVQLSAVAGRDVTVPFNVDAISTATGGGTDYSIPTVSPLVIPAGSTIGGITIDIALDSLDENDETVVVNMDTGGLINALPGAITQHTATILDDDVAPTVTGLLDVASILEDTVSGSVTLTLSLNTASGRNVSLPFTLSGTALEGSDYTATASPVSITAGTLSTSVVITLIADALYEGDETVTLTMGAPGNATLGDSGIYTATITDDDLAPTVDFQLPVSQSGAENTVGSMTATVTLSTVSGKDTTVNYSVGGTASNGSDFTISPASPITIPAGVTTRDITITVLDDTIDEPDQTVVLNIGSLVNGTPGTNLTHTATIVDNDAAPTVSFVPASQTSLGLESGAMNLLVQLSQVSEKVVTVPFTVDAASTATLTDDYTLSLASPLTIPAGDPSVTQTINIVGDVLDELNETVILNMDTVGLVNAAPGAVVVHTATIDDNDNPPTVSFTPASYLTDEALAATVVVTAQLSIASGLEVQVPYAVSILSTATEGPDYTLSPASPLIIPAGQTTATLSVSVLDDLLYEGISEAVIIDMVTGGLVNAAPGATTQHTVTINDNDPDPVVTFNNAISSFSEGVPGGIVDIRVDLDTVSGRDTEVPFSIDAASTASGPDYTVLTASPLIIAEGSAFGLIQVQLSGDALDEYDETLIVNMGVPVNAVTDGTSITQHTLTIQDDDATPTVTFPTVPASLSQSETGTMTVTARLSDPSGRDVTVPFTVDAVSTATGGGVDYSISASPLTIPAGSTNASISINIALDALDENDETVVLNMDTVGLVNAVPGTVTQYTTTILDDDALPAVTFRDVALASLGESGTIDIWVDIAPVSGRNVTVPFTVDAASTAIGGGTDYSILPASPLTIPAGSTGELITLTIAGDLLYEGDETVILNMGAPVNADSTGQTTVHTATLTDDDAVPTVDFQSATQSGAENTVGTMSATVVLSAVSGLPTTVNFSVGGTASNGPDYTVNPAAALVIPAGSSSGNIVITVLDDTVDEADQTVVLSIDSLVNGALGASLTHTATILDNDAAPTVSWNLLNQTSTQELGTMNLKATLSAVSELDITVPYSLNPASTATLTTDFAISPASPLTIAAGSPDATITITIATDILDEDDESVIVTMETAGLINATAGAIAEHTAFIKDDDNTPVITFTSAGASGAEELVGAFTVTAQIDAVSGRDVIVPFDLLASTATGGGTDYSLSNASPLVISQGATIASTTITIVDDLLDEADETVVVNMDTVGLTNALTNGGSITDYTLTILDNDATPTVTFTTGSQSTSEPLAQTVSITAQLSALAGRDVTVPYTLDALSTATSGVDYSLTPVSPLVIPEGQLSASLSLTVSDDLLHESTGETAIINMDTAGLVNATAGATVQHTVTITDDDPAPTVTFGTATSSALEGVGTTNIQVNLNAASGMVTEIPFTIDAASTALGAGEDYTVLTVSPLTIPKGALSASISVQINDDLLDELGETVIANMGVPLYAVTDGGSITQHTLTITDNDATPTVAFSKASEQSLNETGSVTVDVTLSAVSGLPVTVPYTVNGLSTAIDPDDYTITPVSPVSIPAGNPSATTTVNIVPDILSEENETVILDMGTPTNAGQGGVVQFTGTITDDDNVPSASFTTTTGSTPEVSGNTLTATVQLSKTAVGNVTIPYSLTGTAFDTVDYTASPLNQLVIPGGQLTGDIVVTVVGDVLDEPDETVVITLGAAIGASVTLPNTYTGTITDNDAAPTVGFDLATSSGDESLTPASFAVSLSAVSGRTVTADYAVGAGGTALGSGIDYTLAAGTLTFTPGQLTQYVDVDIVDDLIDEADETVVVDLTTATNGTVDGLAASHTYTILDNDVSTISIDDVAVTETAGGVNAVFTVSLSTPAAAIVTVDWATVDGTATVADLDYSNAFGTVTFNPGVTSQSVIVPILDDILDEDAETFTVALSGAVNAAIFDASGIGTINDDDALPVVGFDLTAGSAAESVATVNVAVSLNLASGRTVSVDYSVNGGSTATGGGTDYTLAAGTVTFLPGETTKNIAITVHEDVIDEANETLILDLSGELNAALSVTNRQYTQTITDNDTATIAITDVGVTEVPGGVNAVFDVTLSTPSAVTVTVNWATVDGTATVVGADYTGGSGVLTFLAGETAKTVSVAVLDDALDEDAETFTVVLSGASGATILDDTGIGTITDDDPIPTIGFNLTASSGAETLTPASLAVSLSAPSGRSVTVDYAVNAASTAGRLGEDYTLADGTLTFGPGITTRTIDIDIVDDLLDEGNETVVVDLSNGVNATVDIPTQTHTYTIIDDDAAAISINDVAVTEAVGGVNAVFNVTLSAPSASSVTVNWATADGTALAGVDYTAGSGTLTFLSGETLKTVTVAVSDDILDEDTESFTVGLSLPVGATIADATGLATVADDDALPTVGFGVTTGSSLESVLTVNTAVFLSTASGRTVTVDYAVNAASTATGAGTDYTLAAGTLTFLPGETSQNIVTTVVDDVIDEANETIIIDLSGEVNAALSVSNRQYTHTITDDDTATLSIDDVAVTEAVGGVNTVFTVALSTVSASTVTVNWATANGTATAGADYASASGSLTFTPGQTSQTVTVVTLDDALDEDPETFDVNLSLASGAGILDGTGVATITDDDALPTVAFNLIASSSDEAVPTVTLDVTLSPASGRQVTTDFAVNAASTATGGGVDYTLTAGTLTFAAGEVAKTITVTVVNDSLVEGNETIVADLTGATNASVSGTNGSHTLTIVDNDSASLTIGNATVTEGPAAVASFTVTMSAVSTGAVTVDYTTVDGTATTAAGDYTAASGTLTFAPGETTKVIDVTVADDTLDENAESFTVVLSNVAGATLLGNTGLGTINDNDAAPTVGFALTADSTVENVTPANLAVNLSAPSGLTVTVDYAVNVASTATGGGVDYTLAAGTLTFNPGQTTQNVVIAVVNDTADEGDETVVVDLSNAGNATLDLAADQHIHTITDDDTASLLIGDATVTEAVGGVNAVFNVTLSTASTQTVDVNWATADGTATVADLDYTAASGALTFLPGETAKTVTVVVSDDTLDEDDETFTVTLSGAVGAPVADAVGVGQILDNDATPTIGFDLVSDSAAESIASEITAVSLDAPSGRVVTVNYAVNVSSTATGGGVDYTLAAGTLTFAPGVTTQNITSTVVDDVIDEANETIIIDLSGEVNAILSVTNRQHTHTILDDDTATLSIDDVAVTETVGNVDAVFTVSLSTPSAQAVTVNFATADVSAAAGADYTAVTGNLSFAPGEISKTVAVTVLDDALDEDVETFDVNLSGATGAGIFDATGIGTITDDDATPTVGFALTVASTAENITPALISVNLSAPSGRSVTVDYAVNAASTATGGGVDYTLADGTLTFDPGVTTQDISIALVDDLITEGNETVVLDLSNGFNATVDLAADQHTHTIGDDDTTTLSIDDVTVTEAVGGVNAIFTVSLSTAAAGTVTVDWTAVDGTATALDLDYTASFGSLTFLTGETVKTVTVPVLEDALDEDVETFTVVLSNAVGAPLLDGIGLGTINDNNPTPTVGFDFTTASADESVTPVATAVSLTAASGRTVTVDYTVNTVSSTATGGGTDYTLTAGTLTFAPGVTTQNITTVVVDDVTDESDETVIIDLSGEFNAVLSVSNRQHTYTILDNDTATISIDDVAITEVPGGVSAVFTASLSTPSAATVTVNYATADVTAVAGVTGDYTATSGLLTFPPGSTSQTITVPVLDDALDEDVETFDVNLSGASGATILDGTGIGTITDDDATPTVGFALTTDATLESITPALIAVNLSAPSGRSVTVDYAVNAASTATGGGVDYTLANGTLTFDPGVTTLNVSAALVDDFLTEGDETVVLDLSNGFNATVDLAADQHTHTITDNDSTGLIIDDVVVTEAVGGVDAIFTVSLTTAAAGTVTVDWTAVDGTATTLDLDYTAAFGSLTFLTGETVKTVTVPVLDDALDEDVENFTVSLSNAVGAPINDPTGLGTINDDDATPTVGFDLTADSSDESIASHVTVVSLDSPAGRTITVDYAVNTVSSTATGAGTDYTLANGTLTFAPGVTTQNITTAVVDDTIDEADETVIIDLSGEVNAILSVTNRQHTHTILDNDTATLSIDDVTVTEAGGGVNAVFNVTLSTSSAATVNVNWATADGTAVVAESDYAAGSGALVFAPGEVAKTVTVAVFDDALDENPENFSVNLSGASGAAILDGLGVGTINDNDATPTVGFDLATSSSGEGVPTVNMAVSLSAPSGRTATVDYAVNVASTAVGGGTDYTLAAGTLTFNPGVTTLNISATVVNDTLVEGNETVIVDLTTASNLTVDLAADQHTLTITDDDSANLTIGNVAVTEGPGAVAAFVVTMSTTSTSTVTVNYTTVDGTATVASGDYTAASGILTFNPGVTTQPINVSVINDTLDEASETFTVVLSGASGASILDNTGIATITDDDAPPTAGFDLAASSGAENITPAVMGVSLSGASGLSVTVDYAVNVSSTATGGGVDYTLAAGTLTFAPGVTTQNISMPIVDDALDEGDETVIVDLIGATNGTVDVAANVHTYTIVDNESAAILINDVLVTEAPGGVNADFTVSLSTSSAGTVTVNWASADGTATTADLDYTAASGLVTFLPGETAKTVTVPVLDDALDEDAETFTVNLSGATGAAIADATGIGTITDNDATPTVGFDVTSASAAESVTAISATVSLSAVSGRTATVDYAVNVGSTATGGGVDYTLTAGTLTFLPGETTKVIPATVVNDTIDEGNETIVIDLSGEVNATLSVTNRQHVYTILDDDNATISIDDVGVTEVAGGVDAVFTVTLSTTGASTVTVDYATADVTAVAGADYTTAIGTVTFLPGETVQTIAVPTLNDALDEDVETFTVALSNAVGASLLDATGIGTITDDDATPTVGFTIASSSNSESFTPAVVEVTLAAPSGRTATVDYAVNVASTATGGGVDYTLAAGTLTFNPGTTTQNISIGIVDDALDEGNEDIILDLSGEFNAILDLAAQTHTYTIVDNENSVLLIDDVVVTEAVGGVSANFTVSLSAQSAGTVTVNYATADGTATTAGLDYSAASGVVTFLPGETAKTVTVTVLDDALSEDVETYTVNLSGATGATIADATGIGTINDDDALPTVGFDLTSASSAESTASFSSVVSLDAPAGRTVTVNYAANTISSTATGGGVDYTLASGTLTFLAGETSKSVVVQVHEDLIDETNETVILDLSGEVNAALSVTNRQYTHSIIDNDTATIAIDDVGVTEIAGGVNAIFTVSLSTESASTVGVNWATFDVTAQAAADYTAGSGALSFAPGEVAKTVTVVVLDDALDEDVETFNVTLSGATGATILDNTGIGTITDDDATPTIGFSAITASANENITPAVITVAVSAPAGRTITVDYAVNGVSSTALGGGVDYTLAAGTLTFAAGVTTQDISIDIVDDLLDEGNEDIVIDLSNPVNTVIDVPTQTHTYTIIDNDSTALFIDDVTVTEVAGGVNAVFNVTLSTAAAGTVTVDWATVDGVGETGAVSTALGDFTAASGSLTFLAGETAKTVTVAVLDDALDENAETFTVVLSNAVGAPMGDGSGLGTITDDDVTPTIGFDLTADSSDESILSHNTAVSLTAPAGRTITVDYAVNGVSSTATGGGVDYT
ncbi:MAG: Calx-beta domain-containing protein, partial [Leptospirillia bacterium]